MFEEFEITEDHLRLLRQAWVSWGDDEFGAPCIDPKRPYGNSDVYGDIHEAVTGREWDPDEGGEMSPELRRQYRLLHSGTQMALQIVLRVGEFRAGKYRSERCGEWFRVDD